MKLPTWLLWVHSSCLSQGVPYVLQPNAKCSWTLEVPGNGSGASVSLTAESRDLLLRRICGDAGCGRLYSVSETSAPPNTSCLKDCSSWGPRLENCSTVVENNCTAVSQVACAPSDGGAPVDALSPELLGCVALSVVLLASLSANAALCCRRTGRRRRRRKADCHALHQRHDNDYRDAVDLLKVTTRTPPAEDEAPGARNEVSGSITRPVASPAGCRAKASTDQSLDPSEDSFESSSSASSGECYENLQDSEDPVSPEPDSCYVGFDSPMVFFQKYQSHSGEMVNSLHSGLGNWNCAGEDDDDDGDDDEDNSPFYCPVSSKSHSSSSGDDYDDLGNE